MKRTGRDWDEDSDEIIGNLLFAADRWGSKTEAIRDYGVTRSHQRHDGQEQGDRQGAQQDVCLRECPARTTRPV